MRKLSLTLTGVMLAGAVICSGPVFGAALAESAGSVVTQPSDGPRESIRLFVTRAGERMYLNGHDWLRLDLDRKIEWVEAARLGAIKMGAVLSLPAEVYIGELDRMFTEAPQLRHIEVGQAIEGIAISMKDWDTGESVQDPAESS
ncbi:MAG: hypothetical protein HQL11_05380 [Candidatus Omnitrophica bacterium]|nr:hypothetical protein [Candidatus Omnitrophota bacterium]